MNLWNNEINPITGENSLKEVTPKLIAKFCKQGEHYFEPIRPTSREVRCKKCGMYSYYVLGKQKLVDGKIS